MPPSAAIVIPTRDRPAYLDVALASAAPQAARAGAQLIVVDDGPHAATQDVAARHGARYVVPEHGHGLNVARNAGLDAAGEADLIVFLDDDVAVDDGWLDALLGAAAALPDEAGVLTGPIRYRSEGAQLRVCGRERGPVTEQDFGPHDTDCTHAWGANLAIRSSAIARIGRFDPMLSGAGDEEEWELRWLAAGGRIRSIAAAGVDHRRAGDDAHLPALCRAARARGRQSRRLDERKRAAPGIAAELRTLAGSLWHGPRRRCTMGPVMAAHAFGRLEVALRLAPAAPPVGPDDFLSGTSGNVEGRRALLARATDAALDLRAALDGTRRRAARAAAALPRRRVLALTIARDDLPTLVAEARAELQASRHEVDYVVGAVTGAGKFERLNELLAGRDLTSYDWVLVIDDDVALPAGFLDRFLAAAESAGLRLAQPAHRRHSHAAWPVTRRTAGARLRETSFVEIGPVTAFDRVAAAELLPFPELRMGWGLDVHWAATAREHGWPIGIVDATPIAHTLRPAAATYPRDAAIAEARSFLKGRSYVPRDEVRTLVVHR